MRMMEQSARYDVFAWSAVCVPPDEASQRLSPQPCLHACCAVPSAVLYGVVAVLLLVLSVQATALLELLRRHGEGED